MQAFTRDLVTRHRPGSDLPRLSSDDAEALLDISALLPSPSPEWVEFIGETVSTWLVEHRAPSGVVDSAKAHWLLERIDGRAGQFAHRPCAAATLLREGARGAGRADALSAPPGKPCCARNWAAGYSPDWATLILAGAPAQRAASATAGSGSAKGGHLPASAASPLPAA
jgi:hypothetical protein